MLQKILILLNNKIIKKRIKINIYLNVILILIQFKSKKKNPFSEKKKCRLEK